MDNNQHKDPSSEMRFKSAFDQKRIFMADEQE